MSCAFPTSLADNALAPLLQNPAIWRGKSVAPTRVIPTGFVELDERLPGGGWPCTGLVEFLIPQLGVGELYLVLPALAVLTQNSSGRWCVFTEPPFRPFAPALAAHELNLQKLLFVWKAGGWAFEQALASGDCDAVLGWMPSAHFKTIRRWQLAAERGKNVGFWFRESGSVREASSATLQLALQPLEGGVRIELIKSRGGVRGCFDVRFPRDTFDAGPF